MRVGQLAIFHTRKTGLGTRHHFLPKSGKIVIGANTTHQRATETGMWMEISHAPYAIKVHKRWTHNYCSTNKFGKTSSWLNVFSFPTKQSNVLHYHFSEKFRFWKIRLGRRASTLSYVKYSILPSKYRCNHYQGLKASKSWKILLDVMFVLLTLIHSSQITALAPRSVSANFSYLYTTCMDLVI